ncbi:DNA cytosine methyltransferase [Actinosynnema sp. NPDC050436]|uniref:DNA cytosine methyltransferase n=1 Tax=Actinosynnema sp. NPDC050436 TaxID=3155659 RepID=UPI0033D523F0
MTAPVIPVGSLCTGFGGLDLGVLAALGGGRIAWCCDDDPHIATLLRTRLPGTPNLGDLRQVDWDVVEPVDVLVAGFPCQDISAAGRRAGIEKGRRSGLWHDIVGALRRLRPRLVVVENVGALRWRGGGLDRVLGDLAATGYDALWRCVRACDVGAPHRRERVFVLAWERHRAAAAAHTPRERHRHTRTRGRAGLSPAAVPTAAAFGPAAADSAGQRLDQWLAQLPRQQGQPLASLGRPQPAAHTPHRHETHQRPLREPAGGTGRAGRGEPGAGARVGRRGAAARVPDLGRGARGVDFGGYEPAVRRWEAILGRPAPDPTTTGHRNATVLSPRFVEWMMGLPSGWVTDLPLPRTAQLRALGNGVIPAQAAHAVGLLLEDLRSHLHAEPGREATAA